MKRAIIGGMIVFAACTIWAGSARGADDHMKCYKIKDPLRLRGTPPSPPSWLDLTGPEFGSEQCKIVGGFRLYCTPVTKTVTASIERKIDATGYQAFTPAPLASPETLTEAKICYKIKCANNAVPNPDDLHSVFDQFGNRDVIKYRPFMLCGPAEEGVRYTASLDQAQETPPTGSSATGSCTGILKGTAFTMSCTHNVVAPTAAHVHQAPPGVPGGIVFPFGSPNSPINAVWNMTLGDIGALTTGDLYVNVHSLNCGGCPNGEIRGQWERAP